MALRLSPLIAYVMVLVVSFASLPFLPRWAVWGALAAQGLVAFAGERNPSSPEAPPGAERRPGPGRT